MILVWAFAVPLAGAIAAGLVALLLRWRSTPVPVGLSPILEPEPEPITDPLHPGWRPIGEIVAPLYAEQMPEPAPWAWPSFTQAWPVVQGDPGE